MLNRNPFLIVLLASIVLTPDSLGGDRVTVELDFGATPTGRQESIVVRPGARSVFAAVRVSDPTESHQLHAIGYLGGLDRGIAFGHVISEFNHGVVAALVATPGSAVNPANTPWPFAAFNGAKAFDGPEVQYVEWGADATAVIRADAPPIFLVRIDIRDALPCDVFDFYLADYVTIWRDWVPDFPPAGAFSTTGLNTLDTGGDAVPDQTVTLAGIDADQPVPVPPGAYEVDYIDGPAGGGPATIRVTWPGDLNYDLRVDLQDLAVLLAHFGTPTDIRYEDGDLDEDGTVSLADLASLLAFFGHTCPR